MTAEYWVLHSKNSARSSPAPAGWSTTPSRSGPPSATWPPPPSSARASPQGRFQPSDSPTNVRLPWSGNAPPGLRSQTPSCGRTDEPRPDVTLCDSRAMPPSSRARPASCSTRTSPGPSSHGCWTTCRGPGRAPNGASSRSARSIRGSHGSCPAATRTLPTRATPRARCSSTSTRSTGTRSCWPCSEFRARCCPGSSIRARAWQRARARDCRAGWCSPASRATSRPRFSGRRASHPAWRRTPTAPAASC